MPAEVEREIKLRLASADAGREALARIGAREVRARGFEDNLLLDDPASRLSGAGQVLRLRRDPGGALLTHKAPVEVAEGIKNRYETQLRIEDPDTMQRLLAGLGFQPAFRYQKYRTVFAHADVEILLDETPIGVFLEIEGPSESIHETARALGFAREDYISESYVGLFFAAGGAGDMVFE